MSLLIRRGHREPRYTQPAEDTPTLADLEQEPPTLVDVPADIELARALAAAYLTLLAVASPAVEPPF